MPTPNAKPTSTPHPSGSDDQSHGVLPQQNVYLRQVHRTPLTPIQLERDGDPIWCKLEFLNPSGSTKDRIARHILECAWRQGAIGPGSVVVEASSGSTSIAFALACSQMGLRFVAYIPEAATSERELIIRAYGGEVRRIPGNMSHVLDAAREASATKKWFLGNQFANAANVEAHRRSTGTEILEQIPGGYVDAVVSGIGTGGTLRGLYQAFAEAGCNVSAHAAIPRNGEQWANDPECCSIPFSSNVPGVVEGLSKLYSSWNCTNLREWQIDDRECIGLTQKLWSMGFPVGPSSGLNLAAALKVAALLGPNRHIVTVFPDRMERYFSHKVFKSIVDDTRT